MTVKGLRKGICAAALAASMTLVVPAVSAKPASAPKVKIDRKKARGIGFFAAADYSYTGTVSVSDGDRGFYQRQPFNIFNGNIGISFGRSQLLLYGKNLLDKHLNFGDQPSSGFERQELLSDGSYQRLPRAVVSRPRQLGLQYEVTF